MNLSEEIMKVKLEELWPVMSEQIEMGGSVRFGPKGVSMLPMLRQGTDTVVISKAPDKLKKYDLPLYRRPDGHFVLHRVVAVNADGYTMCGDNQVIRERGVPHEWILAVVTGFYRGDRYVDINDAEYKSYCRKRVRAQYCRGLLGKAKRGIKRLIGR